MMVAGLTDKERREALVWIDKRKRFYRWAYYEPYPKQAEFLGLGSRYRERLFLGGNKIGKTETGSFEVTCHLLGQYPPWWKGKRFDAPVKVWAAGETSLATRDVLQTKFLGEPGVKQLQGSGMIPRDAIIDVSMTHGITDSVDSVHVKHSSGGVSILRFKSYEQGRAKFQGENLDVCWCDEEPPMPIYSEALTRIGANRGIMLLTFTPLQGPTGTVLRFTDEPSPDRAMVVMTLDDVPDSGHLSAETKAEMIRNYPAHERDARARGIPMLGSGRIFTTAEDAITEPPMDYIPAHWPKLWGVDFGIAHAFAAVLMVWDRDNDVVHIHQTVRIVDAISLAHVAAMKKVAAGVPVAWPHDGAERDRNSGEPLATQYRRLGLRMLHQHACWEDGSLSTEAGLYEWDEREKTGRLKVARQLTEWLEERRMYHRKEGAIVKIKDDLMSATRMCLMAKRFARAVSLGPTYARLNEQTVAKNVDFDVFTGGELSP